MTQDINSEKTEKVYIYESPDKGNTIYRRKFMEPHITRELILKTK